MSDMIFLLIACTPDCPIGSVRLDDGLCHLLGTDTGTQATHTDTQAPPEDDAPSDTIVAGCPSQTNTVDYERYPVFIDGTDRRFISIQDGIWGAEDGDVVTVCPGTYNENIDLKGKPITVTSASGPWVTIIDGGGVDSVVTLKNHEPPEAILQGFTLTGGNAVESRHGGGVYVEWGSPTIRHNIITHNSAAIGGGVYVRNGGANVYNNIIAWNEASEGGGGVVCSACVGAYRYNTLYENDCGNGPIGEWYWGIADLEGNILVSEAGEDGAALRWLDPRGDDFETGHNLLWPHEALVLGNQAGAFPDGEGMVLSEPGLVDPHGLDFSLDPGSVAVNAGPPDEQDSDGTRADIGAFGGLHGEWPWP